MHEGHRDRLRATYMEHGIEALHQHQRLELLLTYVIPRRDTNELAHRLISRFGSMERVLAADVRELMRVDGIGPASAVFLTLIGSLMREPIRTPRRTERLNTPEEAAQYCRSLLIDERYESTYVISLDKQRRVIHADLVAIGTLDENVIYPRLIVESALRNAANSVILTHNHPSGDPAPSLNDVETTRKVYDALERISITLNDHIIVGRDQGYSMVRAALLEYGEVARPVMKVAETEGKPADSKGR